MALLYTAIIKAVAFWVVFVSSGVLAAISPILGPISSILLLPSYAFILVTIAFTAFKRPKDFIHFLNLYPLILLFVLAFTSRIWSISPQSSTDESLRLLLHCATAFSVAAWLSPKGGLKMLGLALGVGTALSVAAYPFPSISIGVDGDFRGVYVQKNVLGFSAAMCVIIYFHEMIFERKSFSAVAFIFTSVTAMLLSNSVTALIISAAGTSLLIAIRYAQPSNGILSRSVLSVILLVVVGIGLMAHYAQDSLLQMLGRDTTLTGRTELWEVGEYFISNRPVLGYGYQALSDPSNWLTDYMLTNVGSYALQFHNSLINIQFQLGYPGIALNVLSFALIFVIALKHAGPGKDAPFAALVCAIGIALVLQSASESTFGGSRSLQTFIMALVFLRGCNTHKIRNL
jgi:exopolysaccharide production protein ExoQ